MLPAAVCGIPSGAGFKRVSAAAVNDVHDAAQRIAHSERERERERDRQPYHRWGRRVAGSALGVLAASA